MTEQTLRNVTLYRGEDAAEIVTNARLVGFDVPIALAGAFTAQGDGAPKVGTIANLHLLGDAVVGDLVDLPRRLFEQLRAAGARVRATVYQDFSRGRQRLGKVLQKVTLLDSLTPQTLSDLSRLFDDVSGPVREFTLRTTFDMGVKKMSAITDPLLNELHSKLIAAVHDGDHAEAEAILAKIRDRKAELAGRTLARQTVVSDEGLVGIEAGKELAGRARQYAEDHPGTDLAEAGRQVLAEDPALAAAYNDQPVVVRSLPDNASGKLAQAVREYRQRHPKATHDEAVREVSRMNRDFIRAYARS